MAYSLTLETKVSKKRARLADGAYTGTIKALTQPANGNPFMSFDVAGNEVRFYLNNDVAVEILTSSINTQLDIDVEEDIDFFTWFNGVQGAPVQLWLMSTPTTDGTVYQNVYLYKPTGFEAAVNGAI